MAACIAGGEGGNGNIIIISFAISCAVGITPDAPNNFSKAR
jgi:hypothetical protein